MTELFSPKGVAGFDPHSSGTFNYHGFLEADSVKLRNAHPPPHDLGQMVADLHRGPDAVSPRAMRHADRLHTGGSSHDARSLRDHYGTTSHADPRSLSDAFVDSLPEPTDDRADSGDDAARSYQALLDSLRKPQGRNRRRGRQSHDSGGAGKAGKKASGGAAIGVFIAFAIAAVIISNASDDKRKPDRNRGRNVPPITIHDSAQERNAWQRVDREDAASLKAYLDEYPASQHSTEARELLDVVEGLATLERMAHDPGTQLDDALREAQRARWPRVRERATELAEFIGIRASGAGALSAWVRRNPEHPFASAAHAVLDAHVLESLTDLAAATTSEARFTYALPGPAAIVDVPDTGADDALFTFAVNPDPTRSRVTQLTDSRLLHWLPVRVTAPKPRFNGRAQADDSASARVVVFRCLSGRVTGVAGSRKRYRLEVTCRWHMVDAERRESMGIWTESFQTPDYIHPDNKGDRYWRNEAGERRPYLRINGSNASSGSGGSDDRQYWVPDFLWREQQIARGMIVR